MAEQTVGRTARERARDEITAEIVAAGRRHLSTDGAAGLSLRAVARDLGMVSSAVYRYVPSRDDLLTRLILVTFDDLGEHVDGALQEHPRAAPARRFADVCRAVRAWALQRPAEWALLYGTPVPGYVAPRDTVTTALRLPAAMLRLGEQAQQAGGVVPEPCPPRLRAAIAPTREFAVEVLGHEPSDDLLVATLIAWTHVVGAVSFDVFGHRRDATTDDDRLFTEEMRRVGTWMGLA